MEAKRQGGAFNGRLRRRRRLWCRLCIDCRIVYPPHHCRNILWRILLRIWTAGTDFSVPATFYKPRNNFLAYYFYPIDLPWLPLFPWVMLVNWGIMLESWPPFPVIILYAAAPIPTEAMIGKIWTLLLRMVMSPAFRVYLLTWASICLPIHYVKNVAFLAIC